MIQDTCSSMFVAYLGLELRETGLSQGPRKVRESKEDRALLQRVGSWVASPVLRFTPVYARALENVTSPGGS
jgi:hypothetical protein